MTKLRTVALAQQKGGVGKSSTAITLSVIASGSQKTALLDMDVGQGTSLSWGGKRETARTDEPKVDSASEVSLESSLKALAQSGYGWCFLDLPGRDESASNLAIKLSDFVLIPSRPLDIDLEAAIPTVQACFRSKTPYAVLLNVCPSQANCSRAKAVAQTLIDEGVSVCPVYIIQRVSVPDAIASGKTVTETKPDSPASREFRSLFEWLLNEVK